MRWSVFIVLQILIVAALGGVAYIHQDRVAVLKKPPASIAQWYKPQNKRQVWLHTMFKLRRELQAVNLYAKAGDAKNLHAWAAKLGTDYPKIAEMVPEWQSRVDMTALYDVQNHASAGRFEEVIQAASRLQDSCTACHADFRAVTAAMYRAPDFADMKLPSGENLKSHMGALSQHVNRIKIAFVDGRDDAALAAYADLKEGMGRLGTTCAKCHKDNTQPYPNATVTAAMATLEHSLTAGTLKDKGRALGTVAVLACAQCHGTHRLSSDARQLLTQPRSWRELLQHSF